MSEDEGLPLAFRGSLCVAVLEQRSAHLPVPMSLFVCPIISPRVYSVCTVNHRGKPGPLPAGVVRKISWLVLMFLLLPPMLFVLGVLPEYNPASTPPFRPGDFFFFFFAEPVCGTVPTQIETRQCALCLL